MRAADDEPSTLGEVIDRSEIENVSDDFRVPSERVAEWKELKAKKRIRRTHKISGEEYFYAEGNIPFPDNLDQPSRTILTGEGGTSPSRFKHIVEDPRGGYRRLTPEDLELLNGFPAGWTEVGDMKPGRRAFLMGNALIVGVIKLIGDELASRSPVGPSSST